MSDYIDLIAEDTESTSSRPSKRPRGLTSKPSKNGSNLPSVNEEYALNILEPVVEKNSQDRRVRVEDALEDDLEFLDEQVIEVIDEPKKKKNGRTTKKN
ncbi:14183_t:CDS:2 [Gigaspora rosea]|nr:14183_t:CDS:2 [Gigaspora rosea]